MELHDILCADVGTSDSEVTVVVIIIFIFFEDYIFMACFCLNFFQLQKDAVNEAIEHIRKRYEGTPTFYISAPCEGARGQVLSS